MNYTIWFMKESIRVLVNYHVREYQRKYNILYSFVTEL
jgi:hypothetical protein